MKWIICYVVLLISEITCLNITIGLILPSNTTFQYCLSRVKPGVDIAIENVTSHGGILSGKDVFFNVIMKDSQNSEIHGPLSAIDIYKRVELFLGPVHGYALAPVARFSPYWNISVITAGGPDVKLGDKKEFSLLTRISAFYEQAVELLRLLNIRYEWKRFGLIYHRDRTTTGKCYQQIWAAHEMIRKRFVDQTYPVKWTFDENNRTEFNPRRILEEAKKSVRIVFMCASPDSIREIMIEAYEMGFINGEYVFFNIDLFGSKEQLEKPWHRKDDKNHLAKKAYEALLTITLKKPDSPEYEDFSRKVKEKAYQEFGNFKYGEVNSFVGAFHDAVLLYSLALNETIAENGSVSDGKEITSKMWNRTFDGITGTVSIDNNGDRASDYSLLNYDSEQDKFTVAGNYFGNTKKYTQSRDIHWAGNQKNPPPDKPECGFDGSGCQQDSRFPTWAIVTIAFTLLLAVIGVVGVLYYRRYQLEVELNSMNWRIRSDELIQNRRAARQGGLQSSVASGLDHRGSVIPMVPRLSVIAENGQPMHKMSTSSRYRGSCSLAHARSSAGLVAVALVTTTNEARRDSKTSYVSRLSIDTLAAMDPGVMGKQQQMFTKTAFYKNSIVALKPLAVRTVTITRSFLMEIKNMKNLQNDHIVRFIGVCLDPDSEFIVTEYCQKGSLQDIIENDQICLDAMFKHSLISDITRGMDYLHASVIRYHGNLKSTNCVVDSRFVLKITDFGLKPLKTNGHKNSSEEEEKYQMCRRKLWTAPEILNAVNPPSVQAYQKADVYSFAIICQEVIYRRGVFYMEEDESLDPADIIESLTRDRTLRPTLHDGDCDEEQEAAFIRKCWAVEPLDRPDFQLIKNTYRRFAKHTGRGTLVENLLSRMELYANNLEGLVEDRTQSYLEQKKKAEDLLYMMLPKSIASDLIKGQSVKAEWFDEVTIYFSDICGFTALSAESTPMQVVAMLNDLYTAFDNVVEEFDVYKVETIGDAYMVVSGLPNRNGHNHAREIARLSLKLLERVQTFEIRHKPTEKLKLRIGMHTGPVCAGVVGLKMPRYCLFGDTVNTASRMESNGLPLQIHVSPFTKELLDKFGTFQLQLRGEVEMKGKGKVTTYWLLGETTNDTPATNEDSSHSRKVVINPDVGTSKNKANQPSSIAEELDTEPARSNNIRFSGADDSRQEPIPLLPSANNNSSPKVTKFKENGVEFHSATENTPLVNGHAEDVV